MFRVITLNGPWKNVLSGPALSPVRMGPPFTGSMDAEKQTGAGLLSSKKIIRTADEKCKPVKIRPVNLRGFILVGLTIASMCVRAPIPQNEPVAGFTLPE